MQRTAIPAPGTIGLGAVVDPNDPFFQLGLAIACLDRVHGRMQRMTWRYLREASRNGDYTTSPAGVRYITEDRVDAFGHCYMGCQGTRSCGLGPTRFLGEGREAFRETMKYFTLGIWGHNSFEEDVRNQAIGRWLGQSIPGSDCYHLSYRAVANGSLQLHGHNTSEDPALRRIYNCASITLDDRTYDVGWRLVPHSYLTHLRY